MNKTSRLKAGQKVFLKDSCADIYMGVYGGSPGVVKKSREDHLGYPIVYIVWDKDDWKYNSQPDGTYPADHFEIIEDDFNVSEELMSSKDKSPGDKELLDFVLKSMGVPRDAVEQAYSDISEDEEFGGRGIDRIAEKMADSDGFIAVVVEKSDDDSSHVSVYADLNNSESAIVASRAMISALGGVYDQIFSLSEDDEDE